MLTVDYDRLRVGPGTRLLDLGCGRGRHTFEALRRGASVVAVDLSAEDLAVTKEWCHAMVLAGEPAAGAHAGTIRADLRRLPSPTRAWTG